MIPVYKIEMVEGKDFASKWGVVDLERMNDRAQTILNEYSDKGYKLHSFNVWADPYGRTNFILTFEYADEIV